MFRFLGLKHFFATPPKGGGGDNDGDNENDDVM